MREKKIEIKWENTTTKKCWNSDMNWVVGYIQIYIHACSTSTSAWAHVFDRSSWNSVPADKYITYNELPKKKFLKNIVFMI